MKKEVLLVVSTHGNEPIGSEIVSELRKKGYTDQFDMLIANPRASQQKTRFIDSDLNRAYPGNPFSTSYEKKLAVKNIKIAKQYKYVIDLHEASEGNDSFIIVSKKRLPKKFPVSAVGIDTVILWPNPRGPMTQILENGIELEFGMKGQDRKKVLAEGVDVVASFLDNIKKGSMVENKQDIYLVFGELTERQFNKSDMNISELSDFKETEVMGKKFFPLLVRQYLELGIVCYKMQKID